MQIKGNYKKNLQIKSKRRSSYTFLKIFGSIFSLLNTIFRYHVNSYHFKASYFKYNYSRYQIQVPYFRYEFQSPYFYFHIFRCHLQPRNLFLDINSKHHIYGYHVSGYPSRHHISKQNTSRYQNKLPCLQISFQAAYSRYRLFFKNFFKVSFFSTKYQVP